MDTGFLFIVLLVVGAIAITVAILRTVFRVNEMILNQKEQIKLLREIKKSIVNQKENDPFV